jgi:hypothetical protein
MTPRNREACRYVFRSFAKRLAEKAIESEAAADRQALFDEVLMGHRTRRTAR